MIEADVNVAIEKVRKWRDAHHLAPVEVAQVRAESVAFALRKRLWRCRVCVKLILKMRVATGSIYEVFEPNVFYFLSLE